MLNASLSCVDMPHGGKRPGAGRPPRPATSRIAARLDADATRIIAELRKLNNWTLTQALEFCIKNQNLSK